MPGSALVSSYGLILNAGYGLVLAYLASFYAPLLCLTEAANNMLAWLKVRNSFSCNSRLFSLESVTAITFIQMWNSI